MSHFICKYFLISIALLLSSYANAQVQRCHTMEYLEELKRSDPQIEQKIANARNLAAQFSANANGQRSSRATLLIPVVVHVMHNGEAVGTGKNISDAQILSQIEVLNEDYQALNGDIGNVPGHFASVTGNAEIQFCLATSDPQGNPTNGIDRVSMGSTGTWNDSRKSGTTWNATQYLNIWVTQISGGTLGYATFPGSPLTSDGVVIDYRYFGRTPSNPFTGKFDLGRTTTHEVGHWLGLDHTFLGGCSGTNAANCSTAGDRICDTPPTSSPNYGCSLSINRNTCTETPVDLPDMWMNYMDYMDDACLYMFTQGQVDVMRGILNTTRSGILNSPGCDTYNVFSFSGQVVDANTGIGVADAKVLFQGPRILELVADGNGNFSASNFREGTYAVYAGAWGYLTVEIIAAIDSVSPPLVIPVESGYYDDFILDYGWTVTGTATTGMWERGVPIGTTFNGMTSNPGSDIPGDFGDKCFVTGNGGGSAGFDDIDDGNTVLTSPVFDLSAYHDPYLSYYRWFFNDGGTGNPNDSLIITLSNGIETIIVEIIDANIPNTNQWISNNIRIKDFLLPTSSMQLLIEAFDKDPGHLVEAGFDGFMIVDSLPSVNPVSVSGIIVSELGSGINAVTIAATGGANPSGMTDTDGSYSLVFNSGDSATVNPSKDNDASTANGISTLDILLIQRHILGEEKLNSPYKIIAADVNASLSVSMLDILFIRSVILQNATTFPDGKLWAFVPDDFVFADPENPFPVMQSRSYSSLVSDLTNQNFIGVKLGDVNNSWDPNTAKQGAVGDVQFSMDEYNVLPGSEITIPVKVKDFKYITGFQFTLTWNPDVLSLLEVRNAALSGYFGKQRSAEGMLSALWHDESAKAAMLDNEVAVFEMKFKVVGASGMLSELKIGSEAAASEAYNERLDLLNIVPQNGKVKVGEADQLHPAMSGLSLSVAPNPFGRATNIIFNIPKDESVKMMIYDLQGKQVKAFAGNYAAGEHHLEWDGSDDAGNVLSEGLYHIRMIANVNFLNQKVLILR